MSTDVQSLAPLRPTIIRCSQFHRDQLLSMEWLRANRLGAYSSSTVVGCNTRRYHGLLVAATQPPVGRIVALSSVMEQVVIRGKTYDLATNEFTDTFSPSGYSNVTEFHDGPDACFVYTLGSTKLTKRVVLSDTDNAVAIRYELDGPADQLLLRPFTTMRDFHALRYALAANEMGFLPMEDDGVEIHDGMSGYPGLFLHVTDGLFQADPQWWYRLLYRVDQARGQEANEDIYSPGVFIWAPGQSAECTLRASLGAPPEMRYRTVTSRLRRRQAELLASFADAPTPTRRLAVATDVYIVDRTTPNTASGASILAGFPWFADWGRDTFIALPGLLLCTGRFELARRVFQTYVDSLSEGMIPNRFDDYSDTAHFNSVDASLWFILAAERYCRATNDETFWHDVLCPACREIVSRYATGARFGIHADADGLLIAGSRETQLTWMDAKLGAEAITPRWGKAVEINALWYCAHRILADRLTADPAAAQVYADEATRISQAFLDVFWNKKFEWLHDVVNEDGADASLRPNQIFAASLPYSPLSLGQQRNVLRAVRENLFTPMGLRTLSPLDPRYRKHYGGGGESRERAYHQGSVWAWLMGPYIEAHLKVENAVQTPKAIAQAEAWLRELDAHLDTAGIGQISEIFDGSPPHEPHGCFAQAWSVAEVLRAKCLIEECKTQCTGWE